MEEGLIAMMECYKLSEVSVQWKRCGGSNGGEVEEESKVVGKWVVVAGVSV